MGGLTIHGSSWTYRQGCRCEDCTAANTEIVRAYRARNGQRVTRRAYVCGERRTYIAGCRCDACRLAEKIYRSKYRLRKDHQ